MLVVSCEREGTRGASIKNVVETPVLSQFHHNAVFAVVVNDAKEADDIFVLYVIQNCNLQARRENELKYVRLINLENYLPCAERCVTIWLLQCSLLTQMIHAKCLRATTSSDFNFVRKFKVLFTKNRDAFQIIFHYLKQQFGRCYLKLIDDIFCNIRVETFQ